MLLQISLHFVVQDSQKDFQKKIFFRKMLNPGFLFHRIFPNFDFPSLHFRGHNRLIIIILTCLAKQKKRERLISLSF